MHSTGGHATGVDDRPAMSLLGGFSLRVGNRSAALPLHARRVLAYLALDKSAEPDCDRRILAERLWPDSSDDRCRASLRTALWRIRRASTELLFDDADRVTIADTVHVDVYLYRTEAARMLEGGSDCALNRGGLMAQATELLPGWDESWLVLAREQLRQLRLHALEVEANRLTGQGRHAEAIDVMLAVVADEPLRESAQAVLIDAHLAEGNVFEARRQFEIFAEQLWAELAICPSADLYATVGAIPPRDVRSSTGPRSARLGGADWARPSAARIS